MKQLITTLGLRQRSEVGVIFPHEHIFVDLRPPKLSDYRSVDPASVVRLMAPQIDAIAAQGVTALVDCATGGVGRRADVSLAVSQATGMPIVVATGNYREPWIPRWVSEATEAQLEGWMLAELTEEIEHTGVQAAWIKVSAGDDGITPLETSILRAAARAAARTGATIGSHTIRGRVVLEQLDILAAEGVDPGRFIWIHTQEEPDFELHKAVAARGAWIEYDHVGRAPDDVLVRMIGRAIEHGLERHLLISQDRGWYDPAEPNGGSPLPYTHLVGSLLPALTSAGISGETLRRLTEDNPFDAFAR